MFVTVSGQLGTGEGDLLPALAERLGFRLVDQAAVERRSAEHATHLPDVSFTGERWHAAKGFRRFRDTAHHQVDALRSAIDALLAEGPAIVVGCGAVHLYRDDPRAIHLRFIAPLGERAVRVAHERDLSIDPALSFFIGLCPAH